MLPLAPKHVAALFLAALAGRAVADERVVKLRFAWPANLSAAVTVDHTATPAADGQSYQLRGRLVAEPRSNGIAVRWVDLKGNATGAEAAAVRAVDKLVAYVDSEGKVEQVIGIPEAVEAMRAAPPFDADTPQVKQFLQLAPSMLETSEREDWLWMVGFWAGRELVLVKDQSVDRDVPLAFLPGAQIRAHVELRAVRWTKCPAPAAGRCVELYAIQEPNRQDLASIVEDVSNRAKVSRDAVEEMLALDAAVTEVSLVVDPATLMPYRMTRTKTLTRRDAAGKPVKTVLVERQTFRYP
jgi:hypothetical protein